MPFDSLPQKIPLTQTERDIAILRNALIHLSSRWCWAQGRWDSGAAHCAVGWLGVAAYGPGYTRDSARLLSVRLLGPVLPIRWRMLHRLLSLSSAGVILYNDVPWRLKSTMVRLFDRAIARLEARI